MLTNTPGLVCRWLQEQTKRDKKFAEDKAKVFEEHSLPYTRGRVHSTHRRHHPLQLLALGTSDFEIARIKQLKRVLAEVSDSFRARIIYAYLSVCQLIGWLFRPWSPPPGCYCHSFKACTRSP